jgi:nicotinamidase-related amidase
MPFDHTALERTALVIVDMDNDNCTGFYTVYNVDEYAANAVAVRDACRSAGIQVIHAKHAYANHGKDAILNEMRLDDGVTPAASVEGTWGHQIIDPLDPGDRDLVVRKHRWDAFYNTTMLNVLHALKAEQIVFIGGFTEACVATSVFGAYFNDYPCAVVVDAASCDNPLAHKVGILTMANWVYDLTLFTSENFVRWASRQPARYWWAGLYNQMPYRTADEIDARYDTILAGNHTSESGHPDETSAAATASLAP